MGWTSFPTTSQPTTQELNALVDAEFPPEATIIDRSGWLDHRHHRYTLLQLPSIEDATDPARHLISVTTVENRNDRINYKTIDETAGPFLYDCPSRIIKKAMTTPPLNAIAENWRLKVMNKHRRDREAERLLKDLKAQYPHGQLEFIVGGQQVLYRPAVYLGRKVHTYHLPRQNILHVLRRRANRP